MPRKRTPGGRPRNQLSIAVSGTTCNRLRAHCQASGISMTQLIDTLVADIAKGGD